MSHRIVMDTNVFIAAMLSRLRRLAKHREMSVNKLMEELATISLSEFDAETRFRTLASRGSAKKGLAILDRLDAAFARTPAKSGT